MTVSPRASMALRQARRWIVRVLARSQGRWAVEFVGVDLSVVRTSSAAAPSHRPSTITKEEEKAKEMFVAAKRRYYVPPLTKESLPTAIVVLFFTR